jgi:hypothetical protein
VVVGESWVAAAVCVGDALAVGEDGGRRGKGGIRSTRLSLVARTLQIGWEVQHVQCGGSKYRTVLRDGVVQLQQHQEKASCDA